MRAAGWFHDLIQDRRGEWSLESLVLVGGIYGWANAGAEYVEWMDEYQPEVWQRAKKSGSLA